MTDPGSIRGLADLFGTLASLPLRRAFYEHVVHDAVVAAATQLVSAHVCQGVDVKDVQPNKDARASGPQLLQLHDDVVSTIGNHLGLDRKASPAECRAVLQRKGARRLANSVGDLQRGRRFPAHPTRDIVQQVQTALACPDITSDVDMPRRQHLVGLKLNAAIPVDPWLKKDPWQTTLPPNGSKLIERQPDDAWNDYGTVLQKTAAPVPLQNRLATLEAQDNEFDDDENEALEIQNEEIKCIQAIRIQAVIRGQRDRKRAATLANSLLKRSKAELTGTVVASAEKNGLDHELTLPEQILRNSSTQTETSKGIAELLKRMNC